MLTFALILVAVSLAVRWIANVSCLGCAVLAFLFLAFCAVLGAS